MSSPFSAISDLRVHWILPGSVPCHNIGIQEKKPACSIDPKLVTPSQRVKTFPDETHTVSAEKLFCSTCRVEFL